ncbi:MAG: M23 family metallopeptidase, partial [Ktedonobacteraceae bacterium]|nr:M23 family metallopeptidase [Ktedonobacteraceae bacterium]
MMPVRWRLYARILLTCVLLLCVLSAGWRFLSDVDAMHSSIAVRTVPPFLHRPYYGRQSIVKRTISFFDHDKPWYVHDRTFVRYDGKTWRKASLAACHSGVNCYDGHNGYDLGLFFEPVLSAASGRVIRAGWYNPTNHNASFGLWVAIDHGNGMATSYGHLSAITVAVGDHVGSQWQIGTSGSTGSATGPHLHMSAYYMPRWLATDPYGWSGSRRDPNVVPDRYLWTDNPNARDSAPDLGRRAPYPGAIVVDDK